MDCNLLSVTETYYWVNKFRYHYIVYKNIPVRCISLQDNHHYTRSALVVIELSFCVPHSNTTLERVFSQMNLIKATFRNQSNNIAWKHFCASESTDYPWTLFTRNISKIQNYVWIAGTISRRFNSGKASARYTRKRKLKISNLPPLDFSNLLLVFSPSNSSDSN